MGTTIRPELSKSNKYWIDRHRYYELKHFCLQYFSWKEFVNATDGLSKRPDLCIFVSDVSDPTAQAAITREHYLEKMQLVQKCAFEADPVIGEYIFKAVIYGLSYDKLNARVEIPCGKDMYYELYRKFFWILNCARK